MNPFLTPATGKWQNRLGPLGEGQLISKPVEVRLETVHAVHQSSVLFSSKIYIYILKFVVVGST